MQMLIGKEFGPKLIELVKNSKKSVKILMYDWRWYPRDIGSQIQIFNQEILRAANRDVQIEARVNHDIVGWAMDVKNISFRCMSGSKTMHSKMILIDDKYLVIGSHNLTKSAFSLNHEMSVLIDDTSIIDRCNKFFDSCK
jgi:phosphatidylserine/phosphatidylglycerophosphate/cardiolipin synthase-like enzyme